MNQYVLCIQEIDQSKIMIVGGKGANLGELSRIKGIPVPEGLCLTTEAFRKITENNQELNSLLKELMHLKADERQNISEISAGIRRVIETVSIPDEIADELAGHLTKFGEKDAYAVRSSATAEDLPTASFAGQQDTYLNITGKEEILRHISRCWASLFTARAVIYRLQNGFDHRKVQLSVIIQKMVFPQVSGVMFTADPVTSNRKCISIDASFGLGEAIVSGLVNTDNYKVNNGKVIDKKISTKTLAVYALKDGGTIEQEIEQDRQNQQALTDMQILQLEQMGRKIEAHFGCPQDIEWCLVDDTFYIVQTRPITTLYPLPEATDSENHVYVSVGHQQMMTDAMRPLGLSFFMLMTPATMRKAGGRLFVDITNMLASPAGRKTLIDVLGKNDPLIKGALITITERDNFIKSLPEDKELTAVDKELPDPGKSDKVAPPSVYQTLNDYDPAIVPDLIKRSQTALDDLKQRIQTSAGSDLLDLILEDIRKLKNDISDSQSIGVIMTAMNAASWINEKMKDWLGEKNAADTISQSVPNNITSEMGLALLDVADVIRPYPEVIEYLQRLKENCFLKEDGFLKEDNFLEKNNFLAEDNFLQELDKLDGGLVVHGAILAFLKKYGMRCAGEIDITKTRWNEKPTILVPIILSNIKNFESKASHRKFEQGRQEALNKEQDLLDRLKQLPDGEQKAKETKRMIGLVRNLSGYREYPKYAIVNRYFVYKQALLKEAELLAKASVIHEKEDIFYLNFEELGEVIRSKKLDPQIITTRKGEYKSYEKINPPRVITSDGEIISGKYNRESLPAGAIVGLPVSTGVIEGRARVILNMENADLEEGDILVTPFTDPSWTPLFVSIKGLITEVGGLMTHGAVIAREYGLPAVVGVENATRLIKDGQRIRVNGTDGYVEIL